MNRTPTLLMRAGLHGAVVLLLLVACGTAPMMAVLVSGENQGSAGAGGIKLLNDETWHEAIACGKAGAECAVTPYLLCPSNPRYTVRLATPYSRVAFSVYEAQRRHRQARPPTVGAVNSWRVGLFVSPASDSQLADSIEKVFVRRGNQTIEPTTITLAPVVIGDRGDGKKVQLSKGFFAFPLDAFRPLSDVTIVFIGPSGEMTCVLNQRELSTLR